MFFVAAGPGIDVVRACAVPLQKSGMFEFLLANVAGMPPDIDVVHVGAVLLQTSGKFELFLTRIARNATGHRCRGRWRGRT